MRLTSRGQVIFEVDAETNSAMAMLMREIFTEMLEPHLRALLVADIATKVMEHYTSDSLAEQVARYVDVSNIADYARRDVIGHLTQDERFNSRLMRHIGDATVGVTNEVVERVTAIIKSQTTTNGDV